MKRLSVMLVVLGLVVACQPSPVENPLVSPLSPLAPPTTDASGSTNVAATSAVDAKAAETRAASAGITGRVVSRPRSWEGKELRIHASPFTPAQDGKSGFFILEPSIHPSAPVAADGDFAIKDVPPGLYVIVGGPTPEEAVAIQEAGQPKVFEVVAGQVLDLGEVHLQ